MEFWGCASKRADPSQFSAVMAAGVHLFPFRTEKLSPPAPMVLGEQSPGRVGRRRISSEKSRASGSFYLPSDGQRQRLEIAGVVRQPLHAVVGHGDRVRVPKTAQGRR